MAGLRWARLVVWPVIATGAAIGVCMMVFRGVGWSWMPQSWADQWVVAGVFGVVVGSVVSAGVTGGAASETVTEAESVIADERGRATGWVWVRRTGRASARGGGQAFSGVRGAGLNGPVRVRSTGDAEAVGPGSAARSGVDLRSED